MDSQVESNPVEANRLIKEFEKRAKEVDTKTTIPSKTTRLIEKFEKKSMGIDDRKGVGQVVKDIKKKFEPDDGPHSPDKASNVIPAGVANKLIERFQEPTSE